MTEPDTKLVKYDRSLSAPLQTVENARNLLMSRAMELAELLAHTAGVRAEDILSTCVTAIVTAEPKAQAKLLECDGTSLLKAATDAHRWGLTVGGVYAEAYFVPRKRKVCLDASYRGMESLVLRSGKILAIQSGVVYAGDEYDVVIGRQPPIVHKPNINAKHSDENIVATFALAWLSPDLAIGESMNRQDLDHIRSKSQMSDFGAYVTDLAEMLRKAPIRRICKHLPMSPSDRLALNEILSREDERDGVRVSPAAAVIEGEARAKEILAGEPDTIEGEVVQPEAEGVSPSQPPQEATPPALDTLAAARKHIGELADTLAEQGRAKGKKTDAAKVVAYATKQALGDSLALDELSLDQTLVVREWFESQKRSEP